MYKHTEILNLDFVQKYKESVEHTQNQNKSLGIKREYIRGVPVCCGMGSHNSVQFTVYSDVPEWSA